MTVAAQDVDRWLRAGLDAARKSAPTGGTAGALTEIGLDGVERMVPHLAKLTAARAAGVLTLLGEGNVDAARRAYFAHVATYEELLGQVTADARKAGAATAGREAAWAAILDTVQVVGLTALKFAIPLLIAAL